MNKLLSKKWFILVLFSLTFLFGAASGVLVESLFILGQVQAFIGNGPQFIASVLQARLTRELSLTEDQQKQLASILDESQTKAINVRDHAAPEIRGIIQDAQVKIVKMLTPDQVKKFNYQMELARKHLSQSPFFPREETQQTPTTPNTAIVSSTK